MTDSEIAQPGTPVRQFTIFLENKVGALMRIVRFLDSVGVEVLGLSVSDSVDATMVRVIVSDPDTVLLHFLEKGIPFSVIEVLVVAIKTDTTDLRRCLSVLLEADININFSYPLLVKPPSGNSLAMHVDNEELAAQRLRECGFKTLFQEQLGR